jgi:hypothetical protein
MHAFLEMATAALGGLIGVALVIGPYLLLQHRSIKRGR